MALKIHLLDDYWLLSDRYNYIISKQVGSRFRHESYHPSIALAIEEHVQSRVKASNCKNIVELKQVLKVFNAKLLDILKSIKETTERGDIKKI